MRPNAQTLGFQWSELYSKMFVFTGPHENNGAPFLTLSITLLKPSRKLE